MFGPPRAWNPHTAALLLALCAPSGLHAQKPASRATPEQQAAVAFDRARSSKASALELEAFLRRMPKGADLHMHLSGAIYAETFLRDAAADRLCIDPQALRLAQAHRPSRPRLPRGRSPRRRTSSPTSRSTTP